VVGDMVKLKAGDGIPADGILLEVRGAQISKGAAAVGSCG
jgi:magnesium-transporting ATPase (P-type)